MVDIKIKRLSLENFKCHSALTLEFNGGNASVYGDNASGKTSIYDALTWLLFGKDSRGNGEKNIEIKPLDASGEVKDHLAVTAVEAVLLVNGDEMSLRRTYKEIWATKRGCSEPSYEGNTSEYYVDGVPCKKNAFQDKVNGLVDEETFRMLTSVSHFADAISWQERRAVLFRVAGVMDDTQILATDERFRPLIEGMDRLSLEDYKRKLLSEKKGFVRAKTDIPARISECQKTIQDTEGLDFARAKAEMETLNAQKEGIAARILAIEHDRAAEDKRFEIREAQLEQSKLESENKAYRDSQVAGGVNIHDLNIRLTALQTRLHNKRTLLEAAEKSIPAYDKQIGESRERWIRVNGETFTGGNCPTCGRELPVQQLMEAANAFDEGKRNRLREIEQTANSQKAAKQQAQTRLAELQEEVAQLEGEVTEIRAQINSAESAKVEVRDMDGFAQLWQSITAKVKALSEQLADIVQNSFDVKEQLRRDLNQIKAEIDSRMAILSKESLLTYAHERIASLRQDAKNAAECLDAIDQMLFLMDEYSRYKTRFVEDSINGMFRLARFRLFREQANGGVEDRCDVVYDGVPYISVNNGMKINLGIDIINTLSSAYGVRVPLFVDNAESVTRLEECGSQIIRLVVSETDKELRVSYEN